MEKERVQQIRLLESQYLKLKWQIARYDQYLKFNHDRGALFRDRITKKLEQFKDNHGRLWDMLIELHKD